MIKEDFIREIVVSGKPHTFYDIHQLSDKGIAGIDRLPFSIKILVENLLRHLDGRVVSKEDLLNIAGWRKRYEFPLEIPYHPARVLMQDFTGVPAVVDLAAMRDAMAAMGGNPDQINPMVPVDLVVDHSVQVDYFGTVTSQRLNVAREYDRNAERYGLLKWAQKHFDNFSVVPPRSGICHQVNLEYLGQTIISAEMDGKIVVYPDTLVGTDSHTTMINGIGVMGWGVGGIEAEAVMLGQPYYMSIPEVIGVRLSGELAAGITATDMVLRITEMLRAHKVVEKFVEFFGPGLKHLTIPDRATIANMSPEYGATMGFFPVDEQAIAYLKLTNREKQAEVVDLCTRAMGLFNDGTKTPDYTETLELDLATVEPAIAGPARPQDRIELADVKKTVANILGKNDPINAGAAPEKRPRIIPVDDQLIEVDLNGRQVTIGHGSIVIAAITSCTNTSNPSVLIGAGLLAENAVKRGLKVPAHVKTSLAPGSKVVIDYLEAAELIPYLEALGFHTVGFGCTTCIGNSGPLPPEIEQAIKTHDLNVAAILSGNRNFEARIHQHIQSNFLASPMLVVAFALAGRIDVDFSIEPVGIDPNGAPVYLSEIWPADEEIQDRVKAHVKQEFFATEYGRIFEGDEYWRDLDVAVGTTFAWDPSSSYIKSPPYFNQFSLQAPALDDIVDARVLLTLGDSVTTDHISPAGAIAEDYPAGRYLIDQGLTQAEFNSYGARRGNHEVMMRGTFGNIRIKNQLVKGKEGSFTIKFPENREMPIYEAAVAYQAENVPLVVLGGKEYGTGSSRDWAAKGTSLLGVRAVIARSFERIHRSNLVGMGVLPLVFKEDKGYQDFGLDGTERFSISGLKALAPRKILKVDVTRADGSTLAFEVIVRLDTEVEVAYYNHGGILPYVLRKMLKA
jgi:aconitate hydratase